jgi:hypothetical protein
VRVVIDRAEIVFHKWRQLKRLADEPALWNPQVFLNPLDANFGAG